MSENKEPIEIESKVTWMCPICMCSGFKTSEEARAHMSNTSPEIIKLLSNDSSFQKWKVGGLLVKKNLVSADFYEIVGTESIGHTIYPLLKPLNGGEDRKPGDSLYTMRYTSDWTLLDEYVKSVEGLKKSLESKKLK
jgi:hypothetical protein